MSYKKLPVTGTTLTNEQVTGKAWNPVSTDWKVMFNDFACHEVYGIRGYGGGTIGLETIVGGTGASLLTSTVSNADRYGVQKVRVGSSAGAVTGYETNGDNAYRFGDGRIKFGCAIRVVDLPTVTENYRIYAGMADAPAVFTTKQTEFLLNYNVSATNWICSSKGTSTNNVDSGIASSTDWVNLEIDVAADLSSAKYYIDGVLVHTESTAANLPVAGTKINFQIMGRASVVTTTNDFEVDWMYVAIKPTNARGSITTWVGE